MSPRDSQSTLDCDLALTVFEAEFSRPVLVDGSGENVGALTSRGWSRLLGNGLNFPCQTEIRFVDVAANRDSYQVVLDPFDSNPARSPVFSRSRLISNGWLITW